jgi:hypothetical protein
MRSASAFRFSKVCSSLNFDRMSTLIEGRSKKSLVDEDEGDEDDDVSV